MVGTIVNINLTVNASKARRTHTPVGPNLVKTLSTVLARVGITLVYLLVTGGATPPRGAVADELGHLVLTRAPVAGIMSTLVLICLAPLAIPARLATTGIVTDEICTLSIVEAGIRGTFIDIFLTQSSSIARLALASVAIDFIHTLSLIQTRVG